MRTKNVSNTIKSISDNQNEIIANIIQLYIKEERFDCDLTTSKGIFYKYGIPKPKHMYDKYPQIEGVKELKEAEELPNETFNSIVIDLPFIINETKSESKGLIEKRFTAFKHQDELYQVNDDMLSLSYRLLKFNGMLVMKTMDFCHSSKQYWIGNYVQNKAAELGFSQVDMFILTAKHRMQPKGNKQRHARKYHSYFFVFTKKRNKRANSKAVELRILIPQQAAA